MKERNHTFDFLCGLCILRMVTQHTANMTGHTHDEWWQMIMMWSYFLMCFFFFKAGYFNKTIGGDTREFITKKTKQLLVPYVSWGLIGFAIYCIFIPGEIERYGHTVEKMEWSHLWRTADVYGNNPLWFLLSFWSAYISVFFMKKIHIVKPISVFQSVILLTFPFISIWLYNHGNPLPLSLNNLFMGIFFFYLGRGWRWCLEKLSKKWGVALCTLLLIIFAVSNVMWHGEYSMSANIFSGNQIASFFNTMLVILGLSGLLIKLQLPRIPVINYIGQHSMVFFVAHFPIIEFYRFAHIVFGRSIFNRWDDFIVLLVFEFALCILLVPHVESVPWLSGRFKK